MEVKTDAGWLIGSCACALAAPINRSLQLFDTHSDPKCEFRCSKTCHASILLGKTHEA